MWRKRSTVLLLAGAMSAITMLALASPSDASRRGESIRILDDCDPATFNAMFGDGVCVGDGDTPVTKFLSEVGATGQAKKWKFKPLMLDVKDGRPVILDNEGGETHTFTMVEKFGGGFLPAINALSGNPVPAAECADTAPDGSLTPKPPSPTNVFVQADKEVAFATAGLVPGHTYMFQCCVHPWMRIVLTVR